MGVPGNSSATSVGAERLHWLRLQKRFDWRVKRGWIPKGAPLACPQYDQVIVVADRLYRYRMGNPPRSAPLQNRQVLLPQFIPQQGQVIG